MPVFEENPYVSLLLVSAVILLISLAGAYIPYVKKMDSRQLHRMVALSAGIFLGILFFMLLPETFDNAHDGADAVPWIAGGFLAVLLADVFLKKRHMDNLCADCTDREHAHRLTSFSAFIGMAIHAAVDGVLISIMVIDGDELGLMAVAAIAIHKFADVFALSSTFRLTSIDRSILYIIAFALITPIAAFASMPIIHIAENMDPLIPLAIAAGTFMYVGIYSLLPEAFHERRDLVVPFILVLIGVAAIAVMSAVLGGHAHT